MSDDLISKQEVSNITRKTGKWQHTNTTRWDAKDKDGKQELEISIVSARCSVCERWAEQVNDDPPYMKYNFCPKCGARMEMEK